VVSQTHAERYESVTSLRFGAAHNIGPSALVRGTASAGPTRRYVAPVLLSPNPHRDPEFRSTAPPTQPLTHLHRLLPGYAATPLIEAAELAAAWGVGRVLAKDESTRFGLSAFKALGASWAVYQLLLQRAGLPAETPWSAASRVRPAAGDLKRLVTATDGNHGRAVAFMARMFGLDAQIFVPAGTIAVRITAMEDVGARVTVVDGDYDDACARAAASLGPDACLVSDTYTPGHEQVTEWIVDGYATMFLEIAASSEIADDVDAVFIPVGVGSLAAAAVRHFRAHPGSTARLVGVEPDDAACVQASLREGSPVRTPGPHRSVMVGLSCGTPSALAWPLLRRGLDATVAVPSSAAEEAMRALAAEGIRSGGTGAASAAGAAAVLGNPASRSLLGLDHRSTVLLLNTEGPTDPEHYAAVTQGQVSCPA
jgi:diaminopropionate ammonia-lyase